MLTGNDIHCSSNYRVNRSILKYFQKHLYCVGFINYKLKPWHTSDALSFNKSPKPGNPRHSHVSALYSADCTQNISKSTTVKRRVNRSLLVITDNSSATSFQDKESSLEDVVENNYEKDHNSTIQLEQCAILSAHSHTIRLYCLLFLS